MKIVLTSMVFVALLANALPAGAQQPMTPMQPNTPYTVQPIPPSYAPPRHITRKRHRRGSIGYHRYYPTPGYYLSAHQLPPVYYPPRH
jgi:hypothetical protein